MPTKLATSGFGYGSNETDGRYDQTKPWAGPGGSGNWSYRGPWSSNEEKLIQQALVVNSMKRALIQEIVRPPLPQIQLFPQKTGYIMEQPGIDDIVSIDRVYMEPRVQWFSGGVAGYTGSTRNGLEGV